MLNTKQNIKRKVNELLGNRGLRNFSARPLYLRARMCLPVTPTFPPSFMANKQEAQECSLPNYWHVLTGQSWLVR